jgi:hypothetical protein
MDEQRRDWTVEDHLRDATPEQVALYRRFEELVHGCGPVTTAVFRTSITFKGSRRGFAGVKPARDGAGLRGFLDLTRSLAGDPRILRGEPYTKRLFVNHFLVRAPEELDDTFRDWVAESYGVGRGDHLRP